MNEKILNALNNLGFETEKLGQFGYGFDYEGIHFVWIDSDDEELLTIAIPGVLDKEDNSELKFYQLMDKLNSVLKYIKVNEYGDSMWLFYERQIIGEEDLEQVLPHMIVHLEQALRHLREAGEDSSSEEVHDEDEELFITSDIEDSDDNNENQD